MNRKRSLLVVSGFGFALLAAACGGPKPSAGAGSPAAPEVNAAGDIPDNQAFVAYTPSSGGYSLKVPEGWARTEVDGAVTFTDKLNSIRIETADAAVPPTVESATRDELAAVRATAANYEPGKVEAVTRSAGPAVRITYRADGSPDAVTGRVIRLDVERYEFWKAGRELILTLSGPQGADNVDPWRTVTDSVRWP